MIVEQIHSSYDHTFLNQRLEIVMFKTTHSWPEIIRNLFGKHKWSYMYTFYFCMTKRRTKISMLMYTENEFYTSELVLCIYGIGKGTELWKKNMTLSQAHKQAKMFFGNKNIVCLFICLSIKPIRELSYYSLLNFYCS